MGIKSKKDEQYFQDFFDNAPVGFHVFGPDRMIIDINQAELDMIGYSQEEIVGKKTWVDLIISEQKGQAQQHWEELLNSGIVKDLPYTLVHKEGHYIYVLLNATARFDEKGHLLNTRGSVLDITKRREAEQAAHNKNIALGEVLARVESEKKQVKQEVADNIEQLIEPLVVKLRRKVDVSGKKILNLLEEGLKDLTASFGSKVSSPYLKLSPKEIEICNMIKRGLSSKEISDILNTSLRTIDNHRNHIRKKLNISQKDINLVSYLQMM
ncbi:hypothetical protein MNBD_UNCLBAC01-1701 [hydrothermal vent metagenome]|uniref:Uncharacterized protein n=1 Tax=hydrothermal vent metagenome TaxID=652676 RepID=A0A3B1DEI0_9ZZZZ